MIWNVYLRKADGNVSPVASKVQATTLVDAQREAEKHLKACQASGVLIGWSVHTVVEPLR